MDLFTLLAVISREIVNIFIAATDMMNSLIPWRKSKIVSILMQIIQFALSSPSFMLREPSITMTFSLIVKDMMLKRTSGKLLLQWTSHVLVLHFAALKISIFSHLVAEWTRNVLLMLLKFMTLRGMCGKRYQLESVIRTNGFLHTWVMHIRSPIKKLWFLEEKVH